MSTEVRTAIYTPTGQLVNVGRTLRDEGGTYYIVTPVDGGSNGFKAKSYQASENELRQPSPTGQPENAGAPTGQVIPLFPNSVPEVPRVAREQEPPSGIDPSKLIWINDPEITAEAIADKIRGIGVISANQILEARASQPEGKFANVDDIPLRVDSLKRFFSLVPIFSVG